MYKIIAISTDKPTAVLSVSGTFVDAATFPELSLFDTKELAETWLRESQSWVGSEYVDSDGSIQIVTHIDPSNVKKNVNGGTKATGLSLKMWEAVLYGNQSSLKSFLKNEASQNAPRSK